MPVMRGPDGKIIEPAGGSAESNEETRRVQRRSVRQPAIPGSGPDDEDTGRTKATRDKAEPPPPPAEQDTGPVRGAARKDDAKASDAKASDDEATKGVGARSMPAEDGGAPKTQILRGPKSKPRKKDDDDKKDTDDGGDDSGGVRDFMEDPVVGWVIVMDGPGKGKSLPLGYGMNSVGRSKTERINLDFGDEQISRTQHAIITYDPRGRKYFVQHGGGKNLTYLNEDDPVLTPMELKGGEDIIIGSTKLRFLPFCGKEFDWQDDSAE